MLKVGVIGAGALGTAISQRISNNLQKVYLYARREKVVNDINDTGYNKDYYPNIKLNNNIYAINDLNEFSDADCIILTIPSSNLREIMVKLVEIVPKQCIFVSTIKGFEKNTFKTASQVIKEFTSNPIVILSGPNIAREIVLNLPNATTLAIESDALKKPMRDIFSSNEFKIQFCNDSIGVELCGILKNILAFSIGICDGLNINDSAKFAILTKGFYETRNIIGKMGGNPDTILNYCGFGDIVTASTLSVSRNHTLGVFYGQKIIIDENRTGVIFEGKNSIKTVKKMCDENNIDSVIVNFVYDILINKENPELSFEKLWGTLE